jgi:outer membrane protein TolC
MDLKLNKKNLISFCLAILAGISMQAQKVYTVSARQAVDLAFQEVSRIKNAKLDYKITEARNKEITGMALPQVNGSIQGNHYLSLPLIQFPDASELQIYDVLGREGVKDGSGNPINKDNAEFKLRNFSFIAPWNVVGGISVNQILFDPQVFVGLQARKTLLEQSKINIEVEELQVKEQVYKAYFAVLIAEKQLLFIQESVKRLEKLASDMNVMYKNGLAEKLDLDRTSVSLNNTKTTENQLKIAITIGYSALKAGMGLKQEDSLKLTDVLTTERVKEGILEDNFSYDNRTEIRFLKKTIDLQGYDVRRYKLMYAPSLMASYNLQRNGQHNTTYEATTGKSWFWYNTNFIGLNVSIPIFDGLQKKYKIQQTQGSLDKTVNILEDTKKLVDMEIFTSRNTLNTAILSMDIQEKNMNLAENVFNTVRKKYEQGLGSSFEVLQTDTDLQLAQSNFFRSLYEATVAKINYLKSLGKL